jgi:DNA-binding transcriptional MerR regulator
MITEEKETEKLFYSIGEVAEQFSVNPSLIRFWEKEFDIIKPRKNKKGNRLFTIEDLQNFRTIYHLVKERGYTLEGARQKLKGGKSKLDQEADIVGKLTKIRSFLVELRNEL